MRVDEEEIVSHLQGAFGRRLKGVLLFGSRARGEADERSDYDLLILLEEYTAEPLGDQLKAYRTLRLFRDGHLTDTTVILVTLRT